METPAAARINLREARKRARASVQPHLASLKLQHRQARRCSRRRHVVSPLPHHQRRITPRRTGGACCRLAATRRWAEGSAGGPGSTPSPRDLLPSSLQRCGWGGVRERAAVFLFNLSPHYPSLLSSPLLYSSSRSWSSARSAALASKSSTPNSSKSASLLQPCVTPERRLALSTTTSPAVDLY